MLSRWLVPGRRLDVHLHFAVDFEGCTICEMVLGFASSRDLDIACRHLKFLEREILLGCQSSYHATKILELKGLDNDEKTTLIQERLMRLVERFPDQFGYDLFEEMQQFSITAKHQFKAVRRTSELSRLIMSLYWFRKRVEKAVAVQPRMRHVEVKCRPILLHTPFGIKEALSICVGLNFMKEHELFEERHFLSALSQLVPRTQAIPGSYYASEGDEEIHVFYIEVEKNQAEPFTKEEVDGLRIKLGKEIKNRIEQLVPPVFMPRNEEEVMRNILLLSHQLKYTRDLPQMIISFDEQTDRDLCFTVVIVRIQGVESLPIKELIQASSLAECASIERVKTVGLLRRRYPKEACVIRVRLKSISFLREDFSVDLLQARMHLVGQLERIFGEIRDYNGGMIAKQTENFHSLQQALGDISLKHSLLLQNFFHSLYPASMSTTLDASYLKTLFTMLIESIDSNRDGASLMTQTGEGVLFSLVKIPDYNMRHQLISHIEGLNLLSNELCTVDMQIFEVSYMGFIYLNGESKKHETFLETLTGLTFAENPSYLSV